MVPLREAEGARSRGGSARGSPAAVGARRLGSDGFKNEK